ncbi:MAG: hypothetical protein ACPLX8_00665 [Nanopusillaceae archaeon]
MISEKTKKFLSRSSGRKLLKEKLGPKAFLDPRELKYPIYNEDMKLDCNLVFSAYLRSKQWKDTKIEQKAKDIFNKNNCGNKLGVELHDYILDRYISSFSLLESRDVYFSGNSYIISKIEPVIVSNTVSQMAKLTESLTPTGIIAMNAVNKSSPIVTLEFSSSKLLKDSLNTFIQEQKAILDGNLIFPVKGTMFIDLEPLYMLDSKLKASFYKFVENASYVTIKGSFQTDLNYITSKVIDTLADSCYNYIIAGIV